MSRVAIVGSGFGLYGYLPAVIRLYGGAIISSKSYHILASRHELQWCMPFIAWRESDNSALESATKAIIAVPPVSQPGIANMTFRMPNITHLLLEKPVSPLPSDAKKLLQLGIESHKNVRVGYTFLYTSWYKSLEEIIKSSITDVRIQWFFCAYHFANKKDTWKRYHSLGGGALRFYGIHLVAILALLGFNKPISSKLEYNEPDQPIAWQASFQNIHGAKCTVFVSTVSRFNRFSVSTSDDGMHLDQLYYADSPFQGKKNSSNEDSRVPILEKLLKTFAEPSNKYEVEYEMINSLWERIEDLH